MTDSFNQSLAEDLEAFTGRPTPDHWTRPACLDNACPEWQRIPGGVRLRASSRPDQWIEWTDAELASFVTELQRGKVVPLP